MFCWTNPDGQDQIFLHGYFDIHIFMGLHTQFADSFPDLLGNQESQIDFVRLRSIQFLLFSRPPELSPLIALQSILGSKRMTGSPGFILALTTPLSFPYYLDPVYCGWLDKPGLELQDDLKNKKIPENFPLCGLTSWFTSTCSYYTP